MGEVPCGAVNSSFPTHTPTHTLSVRAASVTLGLGVEECKKRHGECRFHAAATLLKRRQNPPSLILPQTLQQKRTEGRTQPHSRFVPATVLLVFPLPSALNVAALGVVEGLPPAVPCGISRSLAMPVVQSRGPSAIRVVPFSAGSGAPPASPCAFPARTGKACREGIATFPFLTAARTNVGEASKANAEAVRARSFTAH